MMTWEQVWKLPEGLSHQQDVYNRVENTLDLTVVEEEFVEDLVAEVFVLEDHLGYRWASIIDFLDEVVVAEKEDQLYDMLYDFHNLRTKARYCSEEMINLEWQELVSNGTITIVEAVFEDDTSVFFGYNANNIVIPEVEA